MPAIVSSKTVTNPLGAFLTGAFVSGTERPVPLASTRFDVDIDAGLATVVTRRLFRNAEPEGIEAAITFPIPVHATLFSLEARVGDRVLKARAHRREQARDGYEEAIEDGKTKSFVSAVRALTDAPKVLVVAKSFDDKTLLAHRNVTWAMCIPAGDVTVEELLYHDAIILTEDAVEVLADRTA